VLGKERAAAQIYHRHFLAPGLASTLHFNAVSDAAYFEDLSSRLSSASQSHLLREWRFDYQASPHWQAGLRFQSFQTLEGPRLYRRVPQAFFRSQWPLISEDHPGFGKIGIRAQWTRFSHPDPEQAQGARWVVSPEWSSLIGGGSYHIRPKVGFHATGYVLDRTDLQGPATLTRSLPFFTLESGLAFERPLSFNGKAFSQTLEPRLFYAYVPYREQDSIPVFDTSLKGLDLSTLFSHMRFSGEDRIADAHHLTLAATSRLFNDETGALLWEASLGHRRHFQPRRIKLPQEPALLGTRSELLAAFAGQVAPDLRLETAWQYDLDIHKHPRFETSLHYQPGFARSVGVAYRYLDGSVRDVDTFIQWPIASRWQAVGRYTRSLRESRNTEALAGFEYNAGCWVFRTAFHRFATGPNEATQALYFQLELGGLASLGASPVALLRRSVPGYGKIDGLSSQPVFAHP
jgi:LPS-assembly protein